MLNEKNIEEKINKLGIKTKLKTNEQLKHIFPKNLKINEGKKIDYFWWWYFYITFTIN